MLDFVNQDETRRVIGRKTDSNFLAERDRVAAKQEIVGLQIDFDNMVAGDSGFKQMPLEQIEKKIALPATAYAGQNFDLVVFFGQNKSVQQVTAINRHCADFICVDTLTDLKAGLVYHIRSYVATASFIYGNTLTDLKAMTENQNFSSLLEAA